MKSDRTKILVVFTTIVLLATIAGIYFYNKPHMDYSKIKPEYKLTALSLYSEFEQDEIAANKKYLDKVLEVTGSVAAVNYNTNGTVSLYLEDPMFGVTCTVEILNDVYKIDTFHHIEVGHIIKVKGRCDGMLSDVRISKCHIIDF
jgi:uncharacterized protein (UPF0333 family)